VILSRLRSLPSTCLAKLRSRIERWQRRRDRALIRALQRRTLVRYVDEDRRWKRFTEKTF